MPKDGFDILGRLRSEHFFRAVGSKEHGELQLSITVTDFAGHVWSVSATLASLTEVQYDYAIEDKQLFDWLQRYLASCKLDFCISKDEAYIMVNINEDDVDLDVRIPPEGHLKALDGPGSHETTQALVDAMYAQLLDSRQREKEAVAKLGSVAQITELEGSVRKDGGRISPMSLQQSAQTGDQETALGDNATPSSKRSRADETSERNKDEAKQAVEAKKEVDPNVGKAKVVHGRGRQGRRGFGRFGGR